MFSNDKYIIQRETLVHNLRRRGISDENTLSAILRVPRHEFMLPNYKQYSYYDDAFPIDCEQTISQPYTVAYQTQLLKVKSGDKVLEIGTGSGYQSSILVAMGARVFTVERIEKLYYQAKILLTYLNLLPEVMRFDDGIMGLKDYAPYDKIIVTAGTSIIPEGLKKQLKIGGLIVIPLGKSVHIMTLVKRIEKDSFEYRKFGSFKFVRLKNSIIKN